MTVAALLQELEARLPELEWKIGTLGQALSSARLPRGLFRPRLELTAADCIAEIKADIKALASQQSEYSAYYVAQRIHQKINVLVRLCHLTVNPKMEHVDFSVNKISTRQQWLQSLEKDIHDLTKQQQAMQRALQQIENRQDIEGLLNLQAELGEVEKQVTLAKETFKRATTL